MSLSVIDELRKENQQSASFESKYFLCSNGLYFCEGDEKKTWMSSFLKVEAQVRDEDSLEWGLKVTVRNEDQVNHSVIIPLESIFTDGTEALNRLHRLGLYRVPSKKAKDQLVIYLVEKAKAAPKITHTTRLGWTKSLGSFVTPFTSYGEKIIFQPEDSSDSDLPYETAGTLSDWQNNIARLCNGNSRLILGLSMAFSAPLLRLTEAEGGGAHIRGPSSTGKSTVCKVAASVTGNVLRSWNSTSNAMEALAEKHNDAIFPIDEIGESTARDVSKVLYALPNGQGKARATRSGGTRRTRKFRTFLLSTGEISLEDHMRSGGEAIRAGQEVRIVDIPADAGKGMGIFEKIHEFDSAAKFADHLSVASKNFYGTPIHTFLEKLVVEEKSSLINDIETVRSKFTETFAPTNASGQVKRVAQRFGLIAAGGEIAIDTGILPFVAGECLRSAATCFTDWLTARGTDGDREAEVAIKQVKRFLEMHGDSRFVLIRESSATAIEHQKHELDTSDRAVLSRAGFRKLKEDETEWWILPEIFKLEICKGIDHRLAIKALKERGLLEIAAGKSTVPKHIPNLGTKRVYCLNSKIMEDHNGPTF